MTYEELISNSDYRYHHTATERGYISTKQSPIVEPYKGRFGQGFKVKQNNPRSTSYYLVSYYISNNA